MIASAKPKNRPEKAEFIVSTWPKMDCICRATVGEVTVPLRLAADWAKPAAEISSRVLVPTVLTNRAVKAGALMVPEREMEAVPAGID